ncbi:LysR family transcriptional regulator [Bordetella genomosp. 9]|uniref:LysR family transcriptional regulator n=1 Tax=Bordetella genomosp. 9 TaxID=1416803 RepID=A0A261R2M0_9BORD|nr:LysR family transcriptional regulator [Bordetella genomosp. 9]OZI18892.1 LysR family transcriptional regulator [Bordetella genomosp. 9]
MQIDEQITFRKLEIFLSFIDLGNMTRVAEATGLSVVSVHRALHSLEEGVQCPLFRRDGRKLIPLASAYALAEHAKIAVRHCLQGIEKARQASGFASDRLRVGALYSLTLRTIPTLLTGLRGRRPEVEVDLVLSSNRALLKKLADGELDAIVIAVDEAGVPPELQSVQVFEDAMWFAAPRKSPFAKRHEIDLREFTAAEFVSLSDDFATYHDFARAFQIAGFEPRITMKVGDIFSLINLVSGGIGYALLPGRVADFSTQIQLIPLAEPYALRQQIRLLFQRNRERDPNLLSLAAECRLFRRGASETAA